MKKKLIKVLSCALGLFMTASVLAGCDGCDQARWDATEMNNWGAVVSAGGFMAETENYVYYINGVADTKADNSYGTPVKGALMVADKNNLSKTEIAVPKLFGAADRDAGLYIFGDYVYYGTPSTDKASDGSVAKSEMMFRRAKLDGSKDELIFSVSSLATDYKIVEKNGNVFILYYDKDASALVSYDVSKNEKTEIVKMDEKTEGYESLAHYKFLDNSMLNTVALVYVNTVYSLPYNEDMNAGLETTRPTESYNKVYAYVVGEGSKLIYDGEEEESTYALLNNDANYVYIQKTEEFGKVSAYAVTAEQLANKDKTADAGVEVVPEYVSASGNIIVDLDTVYILPVTAGSNGSTTTVSENAKIYKDTLRVYNGEEKINHTETKELVAIISTLHALFTVHENYLYYYDTGLNICRQDLSKGEDAVEEKVSENSATGLSSWYAPEIMEIGGKDYLFYCDTSEYGCSYIKYVDLGCEVVAEDTDDDGENDLFKLQGYSFLGQLLNSDKASIMQAKIDALVEDVDDNSALIFDTDKDGKYILDANGKLTLEKVAKVKAEYDALPGEVKEEVDAHLFDDYARATEIASLMYKLEGINKLSADDKDSEEFKSFKTIYDSVKAEIKEYYTSGEYNKLGSLINTNIKANFSKATELFEAKK